MSFKPKSRQMKMFRFATRFQLQADCPMCEKLLVWEDGESWHVCSLLGVEVVFTREDWK